MNLKNLCLENISKTLIKSKPKNISDCDKIITYINQLPNRLFCQLEEVFFTKHFVFTSSNSELQYLSWYKVFLQDRAQKHWLLNGGHLLINNSKILWKYRPLTYAVRKGHPKVVETLIDGMKDDQEFLNLVNTDLSRFNPLGKYI